MIGLIKLKPGPALLEHLSELITQQREADSGEKRVLSVYTQPPGDIRPRGGVQNRLPKTSQPAAAGRPLNLRIAGVRNDLRASSSIHFTTKMQIQMVGNPGMYLECPLTTTDCLAEATKAFICARPHVASAGITQPPPPPYAAPD